MTPINPPWAMQNRTDHSALLFRRVLQGTIQEGLCNFNVGNDLLVAIGTGMNVTVARGGAFVLGDTITAQGQYFVYNDGTTTVPVPTAHASLPRMDILCARIRDDQVDGSGTNAWDLHYIAGTPQNPAVAPTPGPSELLLATITVPANASTPSLVTPVRTEGIRVRRGGWLTTDLAFYPVATTSSKSGKRIHWGTASVAVASDGYFTITHGAGFTPTVGFVASTQLSGSGVSQGFIGIDTFGATTIHGRFSGVSAGTTQTLIYMVME